MITAINNSIIGIQNASARIAENAAEISKSGTNLEAQDLTQSLTNLIVAKNDFRANLTVLEIQQQIDENFLDILA